MIEALTERIERLLTRIEESRRTNEWLQQQVQALSAERDHLQLKLQAASQRIEAVLQRLPANTPLAEASNGTTP